MFYRRKLILILLESFGGRLSKLSFQKLLFLLTTRQERPSFEFVPFKYGCFSFQSYADMRTMMKYDLIIESASNGEEFWQVTKAGKLATHMTALTKRDQRALTEIKQAYEHLSSMELTKLTYLRFPYYAIKSEIASNILGNEDLETIRHCVPTNDSPVLFTIGYEGISIESYFNKLIKNNVKVLCDVRNNPVSMKYGFSKNQLSKTSEALGIQYVHFPELGIASSKRRNLNSADDYAALFDEYEATTLKSSRSFQLQLQSLMQANKRIALTCFEANPCMCHRMRLSKALGRLPDWKYETVHL